jgi:hypothetical protein
MRRFFLIPLGVFASALALGCGDRPGVTDPATGVAGPAVEAAATKSLQAFPVAIIDKQAGLTAVFGVPLAAAADVCAGADSPELSIVLIASHPSSSGQPVDKVTATSKDQSAIVWPVIAASDQQDDVCTAIQGVQPLAVGTVHSVYTESELFTGASPHLDSEGFRAEGAVTNQSTGQQFQLQARVQLLISPDGTVKAPVEGFIRLR